MLLQATAYVQSWLAGLRRDERGATMPEYALMVALIAIVAIAAVTALGENVTAVFQEIATRLAGV